MNEMNNTIRELLDRKSVRAFTSQEISEIDKKTILLSAMAAPTAGNQQMYTIIDVQDQRIKEKLAILCDNQPFIGKAPMVLVFCADWRKWYDVYEEAGCNPRKPAVGDLMLAVTDTCIAAQNTVTAAMSLGIGSCYIGDVMENCEEMRKCLELPTYVFPCAMLVFGYPTDQQQQRPKPVRFQLEDIVCTDHYTRKNGTQLREMFEKRGMKDSFESTLQAFCSRKHNSDFSQEMSRSVLEYLKDFQ